MNWTQIANALLGIAAPVALTTLIGLVITGLWKAGGWVAEQALKRRRKLVLAEATAYGEMLRDPEASPSDRARARAEIRLRGFTLEEVESELSVRNWVDAADRFHILAFPVGHPYREWLEAQQSSDADQWLNTAYERQIRMHLVAVMLAMFFVGFVIRHVWLILATGPVAPGG